MSHPVCDADRMKIKNSSWLGLAPVETIARFGAARLVRNLDGRHDLIGGMPADHSAAREWCSLFAPQIVFATPTQTTNSSRHRWPHCQWSRRRL